MDEQFIEFALRGSLRDAVHHRRRRGSTDTGDRQRRLLPGRRLDSVDASSIAEAGTLGGAQAGYFTIDPNGWSGGIGTINANIVDNGDLAANDAAGFQGNGTLTINGSVTGTGSLTVGAQETLALNGPISLTGEGP